MDRACTLEQVSAGFLEFQCDWGKFNKVISIVVLMIRIISLGPPQPHWRPEFRWCIEAAGSVVLTKAIFWTPRRVRDSFQHWKWSGCVDKDTD